ncbi:hypothetical protein Ddye_030587 [Dipteronia dyeriana]|uniref:GRAM domain-containing protein n=1 Tax=Dipteronia dyeriana TaxID=168575 RepID=A0AAD9TGK6_9ROSI|nr:hypothetical protein Ddye_030587 [Dipteronia dyeriana]
MKKMVTEQALGDSIRSSSTDAYSSSASQQQIIPSPANGSSNNKSLVLKRMNKLGKKADKFANGVREHVRLGAKITEIVKGKLTLGARILQGGGMNKVFKKLFNVEEGERLLKTCQCYLSTTAGPIAGLLFISTKKIAFCSERSIKLSSPNGDLLRIHYKVLIPVENLTSVNQSENVKKPSEKYIKIVTVDHFDFWFMGFLNYHKAFNQLQHTISQLLRMKKMVTEQALGDSIRSSSTDAYSSSASQQQIIPSPANGSSNNKSLVLKRMNKLGKKADKFANGVREHVRLGAKITEIVKGKLTLGARILQGGGMNKVFKKLFNVEEGERLLKTCQCYLSTTAGPIAGLLFISTKKIAFCSERSIKLSSPNGDLLRIHYKVLIPVENLTSVNQSENVKKPSEKYIKIVTVDHFDFWFMGFLNYHKAFNQLQHTISQLR